MLYEANAELIHHESPSRGFAGGTRDIIKFIERWKASILSGDPYLSPHLTRDRLARARCAVPTKRNGGINGTRAYSNN